VEKSIRKVVVHTITNLFKNKGYSQALDLKKTLLRRQPTLFYNFFASTFVYSFVLCYCERKVKKGKRKVRKGRRVF